MKVKAIVINGNDTSETGFGRLVKSNSNVENSFKIERFDAIVPDQTDDLMKSLKLTWTWPWSGSKTDEKSGIRMHSYGGKNPKRRIACFLSHFLLWKEVHDTGEPILILEHDAEFLKRFDPKVINLYEAGGLDTIADTMRSISMLDVVITSCTSIAHMAASMGVETWVLPPIANYYVWSNPTNPIEPDLPYTHTQWYGENVKIFQQKKPKVWDDVFDDVASTLSRRYQLKH